MEYDEILPFLEQKPRCLISFKEYIKDIRGVKKEVLNIENYEVINFIRENEFIDKVKIKEYYGEDVENFENFCIYPYIRLVISAPKSKDVFANEGDKEVYVIHLNRAYFTSNLQKIELYDKSIDFNVEDGIRPWDL